MNREINWGHVHTETDINNSLGPLTPPIGFTHQEEETKKYLEFTEGKEQEEVCHIFIYLAFK